VGNAAFEKAVRESRVCRLDPACEVISINNTGVGIPVRDSPPTPRTAMRTFYTWLRGSASFSMTVTPSSGGGRRLKHCSGRHTFTMDVPGWGRITGPLSARCSVSIGLIIQSLCRRVPRVCRRRRRNRGRRLSESGSGPMDDEQSPLLHPVDAEAVAEAGNFSVDSGPSLIQTRILAGSASAAESAAQLAEMQARLAQIGAEANSTLQESLPAPIRAVVELVETPLPPASPPSMPCGPVLLSLFNETYLGADSSGYIFKRRELLNDASENVAWTGPCLKDLHGVAIESDQICGDSWHTGSAARSEIAIEPSDEIAISFRQRFRSPPPLSRLNIRPLSNHARSPTRCPWRPPEERYQSALYLRNSVCHGQDRRTATSGSGTRTTDRQICAAEVLEECEYSTFFHFKAATKICLCSDSEYCGSPNELQGINIFSINQVATNRMLGFVRGSYPTSGHYVLSQNGVEYGIMCRDEASRFEEGRKDGFEVRDPTLVDGVGGTYTDETVFEVGPSRRLPHTSFSLRVLPYSVASASRSLGPS